MAYPGAGGSLGMHMNSYSIVRIGNEYVVQADDKSVLKIGSRRQAARLVVRAAELLSSEAAPPLSPEADAAPSIARDPAGIPDPSEVP
jgi:hypothetical protein